MKDIGDRLAELSKNRRSNDAFYEEERRHDEEVTEDAILFKTIDLQIKGADFQIIFSVFLMLFAFSLGFLLNQNGASDYAHIAAVIFTLIIAVILGILFKNYREEMTKMKKAVTLLKSDQADRSTERVIRKAKTGRRGLFR